MVSKNISKLMLVLLVVALFSLTVSAFGIVMPYWEGRPLVMYPGESKDVVIKLQNVGEEDITVEIKLTQGGDVAQIKERSNVYRVPKGTTNTPINLKVAIPEDEPLGSTHEISLSVKEVSEKSGGMVQLTTAIDKSFTVNVGSKPAETPVKEEAPKNPERSLLLPIIILALVIILAVSMILVHIKNKNKKAVAKARKRKGKL
jgi:flagellar basal body-associated protein FliL